MSPATMQTPAFFDAVPGIFVEDALARTLGAAKDGVIEYSYLDAVKLAGHSCPTLAGAWLMTRAALARLYPDQLPRRGDVKVELRDAQDEGVTGVIGSVAGLITGAAGDGGFKGLGGRHVRRGLLSFGVPMSGVMRFTRMDTGLSVEVSHDMRSVPSPSQLRAQMGAALGPQADPGKVEEFGQTWQAWVRDILINHADDAEVVTLHS